MMTSTPMTPAPRRHPRHHPRHHRRNALVRVLTHAPLMAVLACSTSVPTGGPLSTFCPQQQAAVSGNIDKPTGVALATKTRGDGTQSTYVVMVNPDIKQARAVDLTAGEMVPAPNVYFPMAVKLGPFTEDVAASSDGHVAVALDAEERSLKFFGLGRSNEEEAWRRLGGLVEALDQRPTGLAVRGPQDRLVVAVSHAGDPVGSVTLVRWNKPNVEERVRINVAGQPSGVAFSDDGKLLLVSSADPAGQTTVLDVSGDWASILQGPHPDCSLGARPCVVAAGGPAGQVTAGELKGNPNGDAPTYPVALLLRADMPAVTVVRLQYTPSSALPNAPWVDRMRSPTDRVSATVMLPTFAQAVALAPVGAPRCCYGATANPFSANADTLAAGGFAYAVVALVNGNVAYLDLDARDVSGVRTPRLIDTNANPPGPLVDPDTCNALDVNASSANYSEPGRGGDAGVALSGNRPFMLWEATGDLSGNPPLVQQERSEDYLFRYEGALLGLRGRSLVASDAALVENILSDSQPGFDLVAAGVRPGDSVDIPPQDGCECPGGGTDCVSAALMMVTAVAGPTVRVDSAFEARRCFSDGRAVRYSVRVKDGFSVEGGQTGRAFGRVRFFEKAVLPGVTITLLPAGWSGPVPVLPEDGGNGGPVGVTVVNPPPRDALLAFPLRSNFEPFILNLDDRDVLNGRFQPLGAMPTGLVTGMVPVRVGTTSGNAAIQTRAIGILATAGANLGAGPGLIFQFDLGVYPQCGDPGTGTCLSATQCAPRVSRANTADTSFRFYE